MHPKNIFSEHPDHLFMLIAVSEAQKFQGATSPNPPVGACIVKNGKVLGLGAHPKAGSAHAEIIAISQAKQTHGAAALKGSTLYVTLEPCNHTGRTPPCTTGILEAGISRVVIGARDPNTQVEGKGLEFLKKNGVEVDLGIASAECEDLIRPFQKWIRTGKPWIVHKVALRLSNEGELTMIPESNASTNNATTFTSQHSLREAHLERKKSDAILTGIGTVIRDYPKFNVRYLKDHENRKRIIVVLSDDQREPPQPWLEQEWNLGLEVLVYQDFDQAIQMLGELGVHRVLVEAGPTLSKFVEEKQLWDERIVFLQADPQDIIYRELHPTHQ